MMVFFVRHAKSSWDQSDISDIDRPLNKRGLETAPIMARFIEKRYPLHCPYIISSPATRALTTAKIFAIQYNVSITAIITEDSLYYGDESSYIDCLAQLPDTCESVFIFGHNPIIEILAGNFSNPYHGLVPTCAVFCCENQLSKWKGIKFKDIKIIEHYFPKLLPKTSG